MSKKNFSVDAMRLITNETLKLSTCPPDTRQGMINLLEKILNDSGNYRGFTYLAIDSVPHGQKPGVNYEPSLSVPCRDAVERFKDTDSTRVRYL